MKHTVKITSYLILLFVVAQVVGLVVVAQYVQPQTVFDPETNEATIVIVNEQLPYGIERPDIEASTSYIWIIAAILIGTVLMLLLVRFRTMTLWKLWFFTAILFTLTIAFSAFIPSFVAFLLALTLGYIKVFKPIPLV